MNRFTLVSIAMHVSLLLVAAFHAEKPIPEPTEVELTEGSQEKGDKEGGFNSNDIIPLGNGDGNKELTDFYWGIGITSWEIGVVTEVTGVAEGYCAEAAGIKVDDRILLINGMPKSPQNDIRGDGPSTLTLTIGRRSAIIIITLNRCKVFI